MGKWGWLSPCVVRDGCSRRVLGWAWMILKRHGLLGVRCGWRIRCGVVCLMVWFFAVHIGSVVSGVSGIGDRSVDGPDWGVF